MTRKLESCTSFITRGHKAARSVKLLCLLSDRAHTLHNDRTLFLQTIVLCFFFCFFFFCLFVFYFNCFLHFLWLKNDVTAVKANFHFPVMARKVHDSERTLRDKVKCENKKKVSKKLNTSWRYIDLNFANILEMVRRVELFQYFFFAFYFISASSFRIMYSLCHYK